MTKHCKEQLDPIRYNKSISKEDMPLPPLSIGKKPKPKELYHNE
jgi:hypothetical protein